MGGNPPSRSTGRIVSTEADLTTLTDRPDQPRRRLRVGLLATRFTFFDPHMRDGFADRMRGIGSRCAELLGQEVDVVFPGVVETEEHARRRARLLAAQPLDAVVYAPVMAVPAPLALTALEGVDGAARGLERGAGAAHGRRPLAGRGHRELHHRGVPDVRQRPAAPGPPGEVCTAPLDDAAAVAGCSARVRGAAAAGALRGSTLCASATRCRATSTCPTAEDLPASACARSGRGDELDAAFADAGAGRGARPSLDEVRAARLPRRRRPGRSSAPPAWPTRCARWSTATAPSAARSTATARCCASRTPSASRPASPSRARRCAA